MRTTTIFVLGLLALACRGSGGASDDDATSSTGGNVDGSSTGGPACTLGSEGCACNEGTCEGELSCFSQICVMPPALESSSSGSVETSTSSTAGSTESSGSGDDTSSGSGSDSESSSTGTPVQKCEEEGNHLCQDGVLDTCVRGELLPQSCEDHCAQTGYFTTGCADINDCNCEGYADATCEAIVGDYCNCNSLGGFPCDAAFELNVYNWCFDPTINQGSHDFLVCVGGSPTDTLEECEAAFAACQ
jgi:hypothetical protein